ncbi:hypothetical protein CN514_03885 [Bacillus sp. AFS001701]|nr:hypothetical protein CN514_03885 [Bacillus sp. AFS001701]
MSFIAFAVFLISSKYLSAAIYGSNELSWNTETFQEQLSHIGSTLSNLSIISLLIGIIYLVLAEIRE